MKENTSASARAGPEKESTGKQVNQYDKILRENIEAVLPGLIRDLLGIDSVDSEELPDDIQHTREREPDVLKKITDKEGNTFVLHVEMQVADEKEMVLRMAEYFVLLLRRYKLPVRQYVIYLGQGSPQMKDHLSTETMQFKYRLIALSKIDYRMFLSAPSPEEKMLAILGDFGGTDCRNVVETIVGQIIATSTGDFSRQRCLRQLLILSNLRNLVPDKKIIMESIEKWFKLENDVLYVIGEEKGLEKGKGEKTLEFVRALLLNTHHTIPEIAALANVSESFVVEVKESL